MDLWLLLCPSLKIFTLEYINQQKGPPQHHPQELSQDLQPQAAGTIDGSTSNQSLGGSVAGFLLIWMPHRK